MVRMYWDKVSQAVGLLLSEEEVPESVSRHPAGYEVLVCSKALLGVILGVSWLTGLSSSQNALTVGRGFFE